MRIVRSGCQNMNIVFSYFKFELVSFRQIKKNQECTLKEREKFHMCAWTEQIGASYWFYSLSIENVNLTKRHYHSLFLPWFLQKSNNVTLWQKWFTSSPIATSNYQK